ncbi:uncharacterized protein LOC143288648 [Babylonia areolata]|uniref:uncharacterized protein LOC143288648 n=1 Tax=Babylonia areolata TaxID=304850 RepID=UPI003FD57791
MATSSERAVKSTYESSTSSDSSDVQTETEPNEKLQRFQDAAVTAEYITDLCRWNKPAGTTQTAQDGQLMSSLPSKRCADVNDHEDENPLGTTPQFRDFVAKKLAEKLDREIEFCVTETPASEYAHWISEDVRVIQEGVRLFSDSPSVVCDTEEVPSQPQGARKRHHHRAHKAMSDGCEAERLASVAVTADFLAAERAMWNRLHQSSQDSTENQVTAATTAKNGVPDSAAIQPETGKKKKKKRKKKKKSESGRESVNSKGHDSDSDTVTDPSSHKETLTDSARRKKRKLGDTSASSVSVSDNSAVKKMKTNTENVSCEHWEHVKEKKKHKNTENSITVSSAVDTENGHSGGSTRKKTKHKSVLHTASESNTAKGNDTINMNHGAHKTKKKTHKNAE